MPARVVRAQQTHLPGEPLGAVRSRQVLGPVHGARQAGGEDHRQVSGADHREVSGADHREVSGDHREVSGDHREVSGDHRQVSGADHRE